MPSSSARGSTAFARAPRASAAESPGSAVSCVSRSRSRASVAPGAGVRTNSSGGSPGSAVKARSTRLTRYLERRIASGALRAVPDPATAARLVLETITWFARHRLGDADSANIEDAIARETTIDFLVHGLAPVPERTASTPRRAARRKGA